MGTLSRDTSPEAEAVLIEIVRLQTPEQKICQVVSLTQLARAMARAGLTRRYPHASEEELRKRLAALVLDAETVRRVYGWDPQKEGY